MTSQVTGRPRRLASRTSATVRAVETKGVGREENAATEEQQSPQTAGQGRCRERARETDSDREDGDDSGDQADDRQGAHPEDLGERDEVEADHQERPGRHELGVPGAAQGAHADEDGEELDADPHVVGATRG